MNINKLKEPYILVLIGPPLVGKSTWIRENFISKDIDVNVISRDQLVMDLYGSDDYNKAFKEVNQKEVNDMLERSFIEASKNGDNVIVDMTNLTSKRRKSTLNYFGDEYQKVAVIFPPVDWEEIKRRNEKREIEEQKTIPDHVIKNMLSSYQPVKEEEGFDKIVSI